MLTRRVVVAAGAAFGVTVSLVIAVWAVISEPGAIYSAGDTCVSCVQGLPWLAVGVACALPVLSFAHYVFAAVALQAGSGHALRFRDSARAQLAAAAANRLVPHGVAGAAVNVRYLVRAGLPRGGALSTLGALGVIGGFAQAAVTALVMAPVSVLYLHGADTQLHRLTASQISLTRHVPWPALVALAAVVVGAVAIRGGLRAIQVAREAAADAGRHLLAVARHPGRVLVVFLCQAAITVGLALAFAATVTATAGHQPMALGALVATYLIGTAVGTATPLPAVAGTTEATLVAGLVVGGLDLGTAIVATVTFRIVSYWLPLPLGVLAGRQLRARHLL